MVIIIQHLKGLGGQLITAGEGEEDLYFVATY